MESPATATTELRHLFPLTPEFIGQELVETMRTVTIAVSAFEAIRAETIRRPDDLETGGILLGHVIKGGAHLHVTVAGDPGPQALHELRRFHRDLAHAQTLADQAWVDHQAVWVGEWHTHPTAGPLPSHVDLQSYLGHLTDPELNFDQFLSIIVAGADAELTVTAWIITRTDLIQARLTVTGDAPPERQETS